jgi:hypothetical protein
MIRAIASLAGYGANLLEAYGKHSAEAAARYAVAGQNRRGRGCRQPGTAIRRTLLYRRDEASHLDLDRENRRPRLPKARVSSASLRNVGEFGGN